MNRPQIVLNFRRTNAGYQYISDKEILEQQLFSQKNQLKYNQPGVYPKRESIIQLPKNFLQTEPQQPQQFQIPTEKVDIFPGISLAESFPLKSTPEQTEKQLLDAHIDQLAQEKLSKLEQEKLEKLEKEKQEQELQQRQQQLLGKQNLHLIPSCAHWFSLDSIHQIERNQLPEFFIDVNTEKQYKQFRNFMIQQYRQNPRSYMTTTQCRRKIIGDVQKIIKVHAFLEHWGLINFNASIPQEKETVAMFLPEMYKPNENSLSYCKFANIDENQELFDFYSSKEDQFQINKEGKEIFSTVRMLTRNQRPICDFCGIVCDLLWYESKLPQNSNPNQAATSAEINIQAPDMFICVKCYSESKFPSIMSAQDFYKCDVFSKIQNNPELSNQPSNLVLIFKNITILQELK